MRVPTHYGNAPSGVLLAIGVACVTVLVMMLVATGVEKLIEWLL